MLPSRFKKAHQIISHLLSSVELLKNSIALIIVSNVKGITNNNSDFDGNSVCTEFFSENELEEIVLCFRKFGLFTEVFFDENEFIRATLSGNLLQHKQKSVIIYNSSQKGTGPGRKSLLHAFCNLNNMTIIGSNAYVVSLCRHKYHYNRVLSKLGLPVAESWLFDHYFNWLQNKKPPIGTKVIIKPTYESASIGIDRSSVVFYDKKTDIYLNSRSKEYNQPLTVQKFIEGYEIEVPIINCFGPTCIAPVDIAINGKKYLEQDILTYDVVYNDDYSFYLFDEFPEKQESKILTVAENVARCLGITGFGRVDFRVTKDQRFYITDVATNPHITNHSSFSFLFRELGFDYNDLPIALIGTVINENKQRYDSDQNCKSENR